MPADVLPTPEQLGLVVHRLFVALRLQALNGTVDPRELADVADVAELIGLQFVNRDEAYLRLVVAGLHDLANKYPRARPYVAPLQMTNDEVMECVSARPDSWSSAPATAIHAVN